MEKSRAQWDKNWAEKGLEREINNVSENSCDPHIKTHFPFITHILRNLPKNGVALEAGCGLGQWVFYAEKLGCQSIGLDFTVNTLRLVQRYAARRNSKSTFVLGDIQNLPFESESFDCVLSFGVIEHFVDPSSILREMYRVTKPSGKVLITTPNLYCSHTFSRPISKLLGKWNLCYETSYSPRQLGHLMEDVGFVINSEGVMVGGELFGTAPKLVPLIGPFLHDGLTGISTYVEKKTNLFGFWSYVIVER